MAAAVTVSHPPLSSVPFCQCAGQPLSKWMVNTKMGKNEDPNESRGVFVVRA